MRRVIPLVLVAALAIAGCGSSKKSSSASAANTTQKTELSYFGPGSPLILTLATAPQSDAVKNGMSLVNGFPAAAFGEQALIAKLQQVGLNYQTDIKPLFGNPVMLGSADSSLTGSTQSHLLLVWVTKSASALDGLVKKIPGLSSSSTHDGATIYNLGGLGAAVDGATLVIAFNSASLNAALDRHANGTGFKADDYDRLTSGLPQDPLISAFGDLTTALSSSSAAKARQVPWVGAIRGYGAAVSATESGLTLQYRLDTSGTQLTTEQLPIATGTASPDLAGSLPITVGITNPSQIAAFAESVEKATSPAAYAKFLARQQATKTKTGYNLDDLFKQLTGNLIVSSDTHVTMARAGVSDSATTSKIIAKLATQTGPLFQKNTTATPLGGGFYSIKQSGTTLTLGVVDNQLVVGKATPAQLTSFASAPTTPAAGAQGSVAFRVALVPLLHLTLHSAPPQIVQTILAQIGDITGWAQAAPEALTGSASVAIK